MGGCVSRPKELDGPKYDSSLVKSPVDSDMTAKPVEDDAPAQEVTAETAIESDVKEEPLVDLSEPQPEAETSEVAGLAPEISELKVVDAPGPVTIAEQDVVTEAKEEESNVVDRKESESEEKVLA